MISIVVNAEATTLPKGSTLADLVEARGLEESQVAAEVNKELVPRRRRGERVLHDGDRVELVTMVGGG